MVHAYLCIFLCTKMMTFRRNIKMLPQRLPILGFFNIMQTRCQTPWKKCKDTIQQVSFPTTRVMRRTCLNSNRLSLSHSAWDRDSSDNLTFLVCPVTSNPTSWLLFVHSTSTATEQSECMSDVTTCNEQGAVRNDMLSSRVWIGPSLSKV